MNGALVRKIIGWFDSEHGTPNHQISRWLFLRALGLIYFSAFYALIFQIRGLIGPAGILPADQYLQAIAHGLGSLRFWFAPTLLWFASGPHMLAALCWVGIAASLLIVANVWPRAMLVACFVCFLSFVAAAGDFSGYQSDGMLLEAGFIALFFAPGGLLPGWGRNSLPPKASLFLLQWEWFRIYFESGVVKLASGDPQWRHLTAMDQYYQNGPLPTWVGWYVQHLPHWFHASTVVATLLMELVLVWMLFLPRRWRIVCFFIVTFWQIGVILTANYAFLNYLVLVLAFLLLDDRFLARFVPARWRPTSIEAATIGEPSPPEAISILHVNPDPEAQNEASAPRVVHSTGLHWHLHSLAVSITLVMLTWIFYVTTFLLVHLFWNGIFLPAGPITALEPFRIANQYGLFAVMTPNRYEIEFQGSDDGHTWTTYPFQYKPQEVSKAPGIYAPYQPRFDWNLWFASLGSWSQYPIVPRTEVLLLQDDPDVLALFTGNPFPRKPPREVRAVLWQYWFSSMKEKRTQGIWWHRRLLGLYAPVLEMEADGKIAMVQQPSLLTP